MASEFKALFGTDFVYTVMYSILVHLGPQKNMKFSTEVQQISFSAINQS